MYQDLGKRSQLQLLLREAKTERANYLLIRRLEELGDSIPEINNRLSELQALNIKLITTEQAADMQSDLVQLQQIQYEQQAAASAKDTPVTVSTPSLHRVKFPTATAESKLVMP